MYKRSKYGAKRCIVDGIKFDSQKEARRYNQLKLLQAAGEISDLKLQPVFPIVVEGQKICKYLADFGYYDVKKEATVFEDVKGGKATQTDVWKLKTKLVKAIYGVDIICV